MTHSLMCHQAYEVVLNPMHERLKENTMRYLSILVAVTLTILFTSACQEEPPPVIKEPPKNVVEQTREKVASAVTTAEENTEKVMEHIKEEAHKSMDHAKTEAHKMMDAAHEKMGEMHDSMTPTFSEETLATGKKVYEQTCAACHATGVAGAPKMGDKDAWSSHVHHGMGHMVESVISGKGAMPARGGNASLSDDEIKAAVSYMVEQSR